MQKILITGALGHIGSKFIHGIKTGEYDEVRLLDNLYTQRYASLYGLPKKVRFNFIEEDIRTADLKKHFKNIDIVIHLAAITDAEKSFKMRREVESVNYEGTRRVAEACVHCGSRLIFISTTSVYGTQDSLVDESCPTGKLRPQSPYAESKLKTENMLRTLGKKRGLKYVTCRFGTIFGTSIGMRFHTAVNKFAWQACLGRPITVWRTALNQKRPYLELGDAMRALKLIMDKNVFTNEVYNVLTLNTTVSEIIKTIKRFVPRVRIRYVDSRIMNQLSYTVLCDKFKSLGFNPRGSLERGIEETVTLLRNAHR